MATSNTRRNARNRPAADVTDPQVTDPQPETDAPVVTEPAEEPQEGTVTEPEVTPDPEPESQEEPEDDKAEGDATGEQAQAPADATPKTEHAPDARLTPSVRKFHVLKDPADGQTVLLVKCQGCPWHDRNPNARRVLIISGDIGELTAGRVITLTHAIKGGWWGDWKIEAVIVGTAGDADAKILSGAIPPGVAKVGRWAIQPMPEAVKAEEPAAATA